MKVLVVDDDVVSRMVLMHLIDSCGKYDIVEAEDGLDAWHQLEGGLRPAICFCDLRMPRLSGLELLQRIKSNPELSATPFVLVTSATEKDVIQEASLGGAAGYIVKPFQAEQVRVHLASFSGQAAGGHGHQAALQASSPAASQTAPQVEHPFIHQAEPPAETLRRLGINGDRLLVYLAGFHSQLQAASGDLETLFGHGDQHGAQVRLERLLAGCVTLGLEGAATALKGVVSGRLTNEAVQAVLADVLRAVDQQSALVRQHGLG
jgi:two-component system chemotaxis response regulator CheY